MRIAISGAVVTLTGCGSASEQLVMGQWQEVGQAESPVAGEQSLFVVTTLVPGEEPVVRPGDLVKAKLTVTTVGSDGSTRNNPPPQVIWVWTGRAPQPETGTDFGTYGTLGAGQPRATLIDRHLHEQFQIDLPEGIKPEIAIGTLPVRGLIDYKLSRLRTTGLVHGQRVGPVEWPDVALRRMGEGRPSARLEILEICHGARLYRRTATLTQDGIVVTTGDIQYPRHRQGTLGWSALDAQCTAPDGHVRFQAGPFHRSALQSPTLLYDWSDSYVRLRPADQHPEEWQAP